MSGCNFAGINPQNNLKPGAVLNNMDSLAVKNSERLNADSMNHQKFQEKLACALLYKNAGKPAEALELYIELYAQLKEDAGDYARCVDSSGTDDDGISIDTEQFYNNVDEYLKSDNLACIILNNICVILAETGYKEAARQYFIKLIKYLPDVENASGREIWMEE